MTGITRWKPAPAWHVYPVPGGYREYRHGWQGYSWAVVTAARMARLRPHLGGRALPDPALGGAIPDEPPAFYAVRLDCRGRLDRLCGSAATPVKAGKRARTTPRGSPSMRRGASAALGSAPRGRRRTGTGPRRSCTATGSRGRSAGSPTRAREPGRRGSPPSS